MWRRVADGPPHPPGASPARRTWTTRHVRRRRRSSNDRPRTGPCYGPLSARREFPGRPARCCPPSARTARRWLFLVCPAARLFPNAGNQLDVFVTDMTAGSAARPRPPNSRVRSSPTSSTTSPRRRSRPTGRQVAFVSRRRDFGLTTPAADHSPTRELRPLGAVCHASRPHGDRTGHQGVGRDRDRPDGGDVVRFRLGLGGRQQARFRLTGDQPLPRATQTRQRMPSSPPRRAAAPAEKARESPRSTTSLRARTRTRAPGRRLPVSVRRGTGGALRVIGQGAAARDAHADGARTREGGPPAPLRPIAKASKHVGKAGRVTLVLRPASRYRRYLQRAGRLRSRLEVTVSFRTGAVAPWSRAARSPSRPSGSSQPCCPVRGNANCELRTAHCGLLKTGVRGGGFRRLRSGWTAECHETSKKGRGHARKLSVLRIGSRGSALAMRENRTELQKSVDRRRSTRGHTDHARTALSRPTRAPYRANDASRASL